MLVMRAASFLGSLIFFTTPVAISSNAISNHIKKSIEPTSLVTPDDDDDHSDNEDSAVNDPISLDPDSVFRYIHPLFHDSIRFLTFCTSFTGSDCTLDLSLDDIFSQDGMRKREENSGMCRPQHRTKIRITQPRKPINFQIPTESDINCPKPWVLPLDCSGPEIMSLSKIGNRYRFREVDAVVNCMTGKYKIEKSAPLPQKFRLITILAPVTKIPSRGAFPEEYYLNQYCCQDIRYRVCFFF